MEIALTAPASPKVTVFRLSDRALPPADRTTPCNAQSKPDAPPPATAPLNPLRSSLFLDSHGRPLDLLPSHGRLIGIEPRLSEEIGVVELFVAHYRFRFTTGSN